MKKSKEITNKDEEVAEITQELSEVHNEYLYRIFNNMDKAYFDSVCDAFMSAERILVMGYKDSYGMSVEIMRLLEKVRPKVYFHRWMRDRNDIVYEMAKNSLMIAVSFAPHSRFTVSEAEFMKKIGCDVIAITDSAVNPFRHIADYNVIVEVPKDKVTGFVNTAPVISLFSYAAKYIYSKYKDDVDEHIRTSKKYDDEYIE
ncbi:SIS domain-containing protein [Tyzzerella sp. OttesenSCG-928-J15]|nr:SIS domain-containing protein [Tyzzerella sp. OttesenSCG-928-J15]